MIPLSFINEKFRRESIQWGLMENVKWVFGSDKRMLLGFWGAEFDHQGHARDFSYIHESLEGL